MITKENLKLIDVKTDFEYKFKCSNCNRKLKNAYILNNDFFIIIKKEKNLLKK